MSFDLAGIFGAGVLTYLTPCVLPLIPIYLAALAGGDVRQLSAAGRGQLAVRALLFAVGFVGVFTVMGLAASSIGSLLTAHRLTVQAFGGLLITLFGLKFLGVIEIPWLDRVLRADDRSLATRSASANAVAMGVLFAAGWSPCVGPVLGSVLTYTASTTSDPLVGAGYLATYGLGFAAPLLVTALFAEVALGWLRRLGPWLPRIERATGALLLVVAASLLFDFTPGMEPAPAYAATVAEREASGVPVTGRPAMLELYSSDCPICRQMKPVVERVANDCESDRLAFRAHDVSQAQNKPLISRHRLVGVPTFIFLDDSGTEVARLVGKQSEQALRQALSAVRGESCEGLGILPGRISAGGLDQPTAYEEPLPGEGPQEEEASCLSTTTAATLAKMNSKNPSASPNGTSRSTAPSAASAPSACSPPSP